MYHPNLNRMLNFYGIKIRQVIEYFSFLIGNRAYKWAFKEGTIKHKMVCAYILWIIILESMTHKNCTFHEYCNCLCNFTH